jgi:hypothetical protein
MYCSCSASHHVVVVIALYHHLVVAFLRHDVVVASGPHRGKKNPECPSRAAASGVNIAADASRPLATVRHLC